MREGFDALSRLQEIDLRIMEIERSKQEFPAQLADLEAELADVGRATASVAEKLDRARKSRRDIEVQLDDAKAALDKSQEHLTAVKTNKEYDAVHVEMDNHKHTLAGGEKRLEKIDEDIAKYEAQIADADASSKARVDELTPLVEELKSRIATIDSSVAEAVAGREAIVATVDKMLLRAYENVRKGRKNGCVLSVVTSSDRTCSVCYQKLQPQIVSTLRRGGGITNCLNCGSIMVWQE